MHLETARLVYWSWMQHNAALPMCIIISPRIAKTACKKDRASRSSGDCSLVMKSWMQRYQRLSLSPPLMETACAYQYEGHTSRQAYQHDVDNCRYTAWQHEMQLACCDIAEMTKNALLTAFNTLWSMDPLPLARPWDHLMKALWDHLVLRPVLSDCLSY